MRTEKGPNEIPLAPVDNGKRQWTAGGVKWRERVPCPLMVKFYLDTELFKQRCGASYAASTMHSRGHVYLGYAGNGGC